MTGSPLARVVPWRLPAHLDIALKWRWFRHLLAGDDPESERVYRWFLTVARAAAGTRTWRYTIDGCVQERGPQLLASMRARGYDPAHPVPVRADGALLDGTHRTSCALALDLVVCGRRFPAPSPVTICDLAWFAIRGMAAADRRRLTADWVVLHQVDA